jgi:hypothetical protein
MENITVSVDYSEITLKDYFKVHINNSDGVITVTCIEMPDEIPS